MERRSPNEADVSAAVAALPAFTRLALNLLVECAIRRLDELDGDADVEPDCSEEDAVLPPWFGGESRQLGPGCSISDAGGGEVTTDAGEGPAWVERIDQTRNPRRLEHWYGAAMPDEDVEEDDPQGECTDDDPAFDRRSLARANARGSGPGCAISDSGGGNVEDEPQEEHNAAPTLRYGLDQSRAIGPENPSH